MKLLLTSAGIKNTSIDDALVGSRETDAESSASAFRPPHMPSPAVPAVHGG